MQQLQHSQLMEKNEERGGKKATQGEKREELAQFRAGCVQRAQPGAASTQTQQTQGRALQGSVAAVSPAQISFWDSAELISTARLCSAHALALLPALDPPLSSLPGSRQPQRFFVGLEPAPNWGSGLAQPSCSKV